MKAFKDMNLLIGISGSMAVLIIIPYLIALKQRFAQVRLVLTPAAAEFIPPHVLALLGMKVYTSEFPIEKECENHVKLATWADLMMVLPATANLLAESSQGLGKSLLSSVILAHRYSVLFFPNMHVHMWKKPSVQRNVLQLQKDGHIICLPEERLSFVQATQDMGISCVLPSLEKVLMFIQAHTHDRIDFLENEEKAYVNRSEF